MIDLVLLLIGVILVATGLWWFHPPTCLVVLGIIVVVVAYAHWTADQKAAKSKSNTKSNGASAR